MKICNTLNTFFIFFITVIFLLPNTIFAIYIPNDTLYVWSENTIQTSSENETSADFLDLSCESAILIEQTTGTVLYEKNAHSKLRPASVTKIMTILLIMEALNDGQISYDTIITCSENAASIGGSQIWLEVRRKLNCR